MYQMIIILICSISLVIDAFNFDPINFQISGRPMAANNRMIVAIQNRSIPSFSAVKNYLTSPKFCSVEYNETNVTDLYPMMVAVARNGNLSSNSDLFAFISYSRLMKTIYLIKAIIDFNTCEMNAFYPLNISETDFPKYSTLALDPTGQLAFYFWETHLHIEDLTLTGSRRFFFFGNITSRLFFYPAGVDLRETWGILTGYPADGGLPLDDTILRPVIYRFDYNSCPSVNCFRIMSQWAVPRNIKSYAAIPSVDLFVKNDYKPLYDISVSINDVGGILIGVQSLNTIFRWTSSAISNGPIDSRTISSGISVGFGKSVGWLDDTTAIVLFNAWEPLYTRWRSSTIDLYTLNYSISLSNRQPSYISFPNNHRKLWSSLKRQIIEIMSVVSSGSLILMDVNGLVHVIRPSSIGWYPQTNAGIGLKNTTIYVAPTAKCPSGMFKTIPSKGKDLFLGCDLCPSGTYYFATSNSIADRCFKCSSSGNFCPAGSTNDLSASSLDGEIQIQAYPESPDIDVLEDIMLLNIFSVDFSQHCLLKQPLFWGFIIIGIGLLIMIIMGILKLTDKFPRHRQYLRSLFQQTDLIGQGELWIGGIASFVVLVICIFACRFSSLFINQYPIETADKSTFACNDELYNAKFSTTMQSLATPVSENDQPLFDLLENQKFTLNVDFISTAFLPSQLSVFQVTGTGTRVLSKTASTHDGILYSSTALNAQSITVRFILADNWPIGAIRVGISAPALEDENYKVQALKFSQVFNYTDRILTQDPELTIQLIRLINETEALNSGDDNQYSAVWIPQYQYDFDQMFYSDTEFRTSHIKGSTLVTIRLTKESYFIYNVQEPITRLSELIFTNILFTTMCIEFFALLFLFYKLLLHPFIKLFLRLIGRDNKVHPSGKGNGAGGCPYCQPFDIDALPAYTVPVQRQSPSDFGSKAILE